MLQSFNHIEKVKGELNLPGDKSISHRAVMFSAMAKGTSKIYNLSNGEDVKTTKTCFDALGAKITTEKDFIKVTGYGFKGFKKPSGELYAGNSGTTARLIPGILMAQSFDTVITGDESLSNRPMKRIIDPLSLMGGKFEASEKLTLPLKIFSASNINPINYELPVASAQIKSAVLLAGLHSDGITSVIENLRSRNHTEKMLGLETRNHNNGKIIFVSRLNYPVPAEYFVPSDISSAAFFIVLALLLKNSTLRIKKVGLNETRTGFINLLKEMGGRIEIERAKEISGEAFGDLMISSSEMKNIEIPQSIVPNIIDEIPILSVAGLFSEGDFFIRNAGELRKKESDRINALCINYKKLGLSVEEYEDGFRLSGRISNINPVFESFGDHRIAMAFGILSLLLDSGGKVENFECVNISNPNFLKQIKEISS
jgi:3-phosphoshikimate 1-carboxyvinyltransferase